MMRSWSQLAVPSDKMVSTPEGIMAEKTGCLLGWLLGGGGDATDADALPEVRLSDRFISTAETNFYRVLRQTVGDAAIIAMQASLNQLLYFPGNNRGNPARASWQNRVRGRAVDFVLLDPKSMRPLVAIELDEPSHAKPSRQTRDENVERILEAAGLPLVRVLTSRSYSTTELADVLRPHLVSPPHR